MSDQAFFLPVETRSKGLPPLTEMVGKYWHAGIIHDGRVYECFNHGRYSISGLDEAKVNSLKEQKAIIVDIIGDVGKIEGEITSGTSCSEYVARVVGLSSNSGAVKQYWPEEALKFINSIGA